MGLYDIIGGSTMKGRNKYITNSRYYNKIAKEANNILNNMLFNALVEGKPYQINQDNHNKTVQILQVKQISI